MTQVNQMLNLFVLTSLPGMRVARMPLSQDLQIEISALFRTQEQEFLLGIEEVIKFDGKYRPDDREILFIEDFDDMDILKNAVHNPLGCQEFVLQDGTFESIKAIFSGYENNGLIRVLIQGFDRRRIISTKGFSIFHSANTFTKFDGSGLTLDNKLTAIMEGDNMKFASFHFLRQIFDMSAYYKEATDQDLTAFAEHKALQIANPKAFMEISDTWIRRKIGLIQQSGILDKYSPNQIASAAKHFDIPLALTGQSGEEKLVIPTDRREVKRILRFLDEDYYQAPLTTTKYLSNSKRVAD